MIARLLACGNTKTCVLALLIPNVSLTTVLWDGVLYCPDFFNFYNNSNELLFYRISGFPCKRKKGKIRNA